ncbi:hypothetical protein ACFU8Q_32890 [Streptomyces sp. NPDC057543]|uniref:hypothetical protein n=1 Tax=Streptomyces sp. NPDC057543 TaxID=3346163 RepID=UPI0036A0DB28
MERDIAGDPDAGRVGHVTAAQRQLAEVVEDHPAGGSCPAVVGVKAGRRLLGAQCTPDLAFDQAERHQGQADHLDQGGDAMVVLPLLAQTVGHSSPSAMGSIPGTRCLSATLDG